MVFLLVELIDHLKYYLVYIYVWILKRSTPLIFDFDFNSKDIQKFGVTSLPATWLRDSPRDLQPSIHVCSNVF